MARASDQPIRHQRFPIYYEGVGEFKDARGVPSGAAGAEALVEIGLNNRPHEIVGVRVVNVYEVTDLFEQITYAIPDVTPPVERREVIPVQGFTLPPGDACCFLDRLDGDQLMTLQLAQQNVIVRNLHQRTMTGRAGWHWHPFPCAYPFRGGNNLELNFRRLTSYPINALVDPPEPIIIPKVMVTVLGWVWVSDEGVEPQPPAPPSTGFPQTSARQATNY